MTESLIWSEDEIKRFYDCFFKERKESDVDALCLMVRSKYSSNPEEAYSKFRLDKDNNKSTYAFDTILKDYDWLYFINRIHQMDDAANHLIDFNNIPVPKECASVYMNINHINIISIIDEFESSLNSIKRKYLLEPSKDDMSHYESFCNLCNGYKSSMDYLIEASKNPKNGNIEWIDIDFDIKKEKLEYKEDYAYKALDIVNKLLPPSAYSDKYRPKSFLTCNGFHIIVSSTSMTEYNKSLLSDNTLSDMEKNLKKIDAHMIARELRKDSFGEDFDELKVDFYNRVVVPGTVQGGFKVRMLTY